MYSLKVNHHCSFEQLLTVKKKKKNENFCCWPNKVDHKIASSLWFGWNVEPVVFEAKWRENMPHESRLNDSIYIYIYSAQVPLFECVCVSLERHLFFANILFNTSYSRWTSLKLQRQIISSCSYNNNNIYEKRWNQMRIFCD